MTNNGGILGAGSLIGRLLFVFLNMGINIEKEQFKKFLEKIKKLLYFTVFGNYYK